MASTSAAANAPLEVFISVGRCCSAEQESMIRKVFDYVRKQGLRPVSEKHGDYWPATGSIEALREVMDRASGTIVIAFERTNIEKGQELKSKDLNGEILTTVWNQVEAAMACATRHPMLVLMDHRVREEGLLDRNFPWRVEATDIATFNPHSEEFDRLFSSFRAQMEKFFHSKTHHHSLPRGKRDTMAQVVGSFSPEQLKLLIGSIAALVTTVASLSFLLGRYSAH